MVAVLVVVAGFVGNACSSVDFDGLVGWFGKGCVSVEAVNVYHSPDFRNMTNTSSPSSQMMFSRSM